MLNASDTFMLNRHH